MKSRNNKSLVASILFSLVTLLMFVLAYLAANVDQYSHDGQAASGMNFVVLTHALRAIVVYLFIAVGSSICALAFYLEYRSEYFYNRK